MATLILDVPAPVAAKWYALSEEEKRRRLPGLIEMIEEADRTSREPYEEPPALTESEEAALDIAWADLARKRTNEKEAPQRPND